MAIVKMSEFSLFAFDSSKEKLLHELQKFEYVHFLNLEDREDISDLGLKKVRVPEKIVSVEEDLAKVNHSIEILSKFYKKETGIAAMKKGLETYTFQELEDEALRIEYLPMYENVNNLWKKRDAIRQSVEKNKGKIQELMPWSGLSTNIKDLNSIKACELLIGTVPKKLQDKLTDSMMDSQYTYYEVLEEDKDNLYLIVMSHNNEAEMIKDKLRTISFSRVQLHGEGTPRDVIKTLEEENANYHVEIETLEKEIEKMSDSLPKLELAYDYLNNKKLRIAAAENFMMTEKVNVIKGYIPTDKEADFNKRVEDVLDNTYYLQLKEADKEDIKTPILLKNSKFAQSFESLTSMYALPRYNEIDPTPLLAPFYLAFFGMMAADVGYGLIMLIATFVVLRMFNLSENTKKFVRFFYYLSFSVIIWGFLYGSLFGGIIPLPGLFDPATDYNTLLILSIVFGLIHIYFALALKAYVLIKDGKIKDAMFDVGFWYLALTGAIVYLLNIVMDLPPILKTISLVVMIVGMVGIVATGGRDATSIVGRIGGGVYSLYGISGYVGDFVSYSRLMALGLAGGFIAGAVNMMAGMVAQKGIIGIVFAVVIFIFGQTFNLGLSLLGAYVHTIRLTFVEFFGKFYEGGGIGFKKFKTEPKYINLK